MSSTHSHASTDGPPKAPTVSVQLGPTYRMHGVPCVVCGRAASALALTPQLRVIHHMDARYPCYTHYDTPAESRPHHVQDVQDSTVPSA
jgi:hypothetical protein